MNKPLISVIMPVYNGGIFLKPAIESILKQTHQNLELIIIDDGSKDKSVDVVREFKDPRIIFLQNQQNLGLAGNRNKALRLAKGEFIAIMDDDDISLPLRLEKQLQAFLADPQLSLCGTWAGVINEQGEIVLYWRFPTHPLALKAQFYLQFPVVHTSSMFRTSYLQQFSHFYDLSLEWAEDYDLLFRLTHHHAVAMIPEYLVQYRIHPQNNSSGHKEIYKYQLVEILAREYQQIGLECNRDEIQNFALFLNPKHGPKPSLASALRTSFKLHQALKNYLKLTEKELLHWDTYLFKTLILNWKKAYALSFLNH